MKNEALNNYRTVVKKSSYKERDVISLYKTKKASTDEWILPNV